MKSKLILFSFLMHVPAYILKDLSNCPASETAFHLKSLRLEMLVKVNNGKCYFNVSFKTKACHYPVINAD